MREPNPYVASQYEDGWYVERPDETYPLDSCRFIQVRGPFETKENAEAWIDQRRGVGAAAYFKRIAGRTSVKGGGVSG